MPFLDHELVELAARCPAPLKLAQGGKGVLKEAAPQRHPRRGHRPAQGVLPGARPQPSRGPGPRARRRHAALAQGQGAWTVPRRRGRGAARRPQRVTHAAPRQPSCGRSRCSSSGSRSTACDGRSTGALDRGRGRGGDQCTGAHRLGRRPPRPSPTAAHDAATLDCGWGRLVFGQTFESADAIANALRAEQPGSRDICLYCERSARRGRPGSRPAVHRPVAHLPDQPAQLPTDHEPRPFAARAGPPRTVGRGRGQPAVPAQQHGDRSCGDDLGEPAHRRASRT